MANDHAKELRELAELFGFDADRSEDEDVKESNSRSAAALLAGAEALEYMAELMPIVRECLGDAHRPGCLWLSDKRMPCQCGSWDRINSAIGRCQHLMARCPLPAPPPKEDRHA